MLNILVMVSIITLFALYQITLPLSIALAPRRRFEIAERFARSAVMRIFRLMRTYCGVRLAFENVSGRVLPERFLLVSNHQSLMDIPVCMALFPGRMLRFVAKRELGDGIPFVSSLLRSQGHALVRREGDATQAMQSLRRFSRRCAREGTCPVIFPEGHRSRNGEVGEFHTAGVRKILNEAELPVVVAVLEGGGRIARLGDIPRNLTRSRFVVRVIGVTPALSGKKEVLDAVAEARAGIVAELAGIRAQAAKKNSRLSAAASLGALRGY
jgi:1-acyl-sn-glycerol-3-phosphate acyltransferase